MKRNVSWISAAALLVTLGCLGAVACSNQGEGERCDLNNDSDDCASGLFCRKIEGQESPLCCPPPGQSSTVSACIPGQPLQPDASTSGDSASGDANEDAQDAAQDVTEDVTQDAATDVAVDVEPDVVPDATEDAELDAPEDAMDAGEDASDANDAAG